MACRAVSCDLSCRCVSCLVFLSCIESVPCRAVSFSLRVACQQEPGTSLLLPAMHSSMERTPAVYNEALAIRSRETAPIASYAIDRKCLRKGAEVFTGDNIQSLICFLCGCIYPCLDTDETNAKHIVWMNPCNNPMLFLNYNRQDTEYHFSLESYLQKYSEDPLKHYNLRSHLEEFDDWIADIPFGSEYVRIVCCPEASLSPICGASYCPCPGPPLWPPADTTFLCPLPIISLQGPRR